MLRSASPLYRPIVPLVAILVVAALMRAHALQHGLAYHPDERHMIMVTLDLSEHGMNPRSFAYGSFSYYLLWTTAKIAALFNPALFSYDKLFIIGRGLCVVGGIIGIGLTYLLAKEVYCSAGIALVAAALLAFNTFHIQLSRFFTSDVLLTTICTGHLLAMVRHSKTGSKSSLFVCGVLFGIATATKISSAFLLPSVALALLFSPRRASWGEHLILCVKRGVGIVLIGAVTFAIVEPFAFLDFETFLRQTKEQTDMVQGKWRPPYTIQYEHTLPYLYPLTQIFFYTMGMPLAFAAGLGLVSTIIRQGRQFNPGEWILGGWIITFFATTAGFQVKFPRYLLPIYPELFVLAAAFLWQLGTFISSRFVPTLPVSPSPFVRSAATWHDLAKVVRSSAAVTSESVTHRSHRSSTAPTRWNTLGPLLLAATLVTGSVCLYIRARSPLYSIPLSKWLISYISSAGSGVEYEQTPISIDEVQDIPNVFDRGGFVTPLGGAMAIAVNSLNEVYIVDSISHTLNKFGPNGEPIFSLGKKGDGPQQFNEPRGIDIDDHGDVYVMDTWNGRVQKFAPDGSFLKAWGGDQGLFGPRALTVKGGRVYVVDSGGCRIVEYSDDGELIKTFGKRGSKPGEFFDPVGIAVTDAGAVYVLDSANDRVQKFNPDGSVAKILSVPGWSSRNLKEAHLSYSERAGLFVVDPMSGSVLLFDPTDALVGRIARGLQNPTGIAVRNSMVTIVERLSGKVIRRELVSSKAP